MEQAALLYSTFHHVGMGDVYVAPELHPEVVAELLQEKHRSEALRCVGAVNAVKVRSLP